MAGTTNSSDDEVTSISGLGNVWIVEIDTGGNIVWEKTYGNLTGAYAIKQTSDSGFIIAGYCDDSGGDVTTYFGESDFWVLKIDKTGNLIWQKSLGGPMFDEAKAIYPTFDGGYVIAGFTLSMSGEITDYHGGISDCWLVKLNDTGAVQNLWGYR